MVARTLTPTGARQLIGCTGSVYFRVSGDAKPYYPNNQDAHPSGSRDLRATMTNGYYYLKQTLPNITKGFCVWAFACFYLGRAGSTALMQKLYMHKSHTLGKRVPTIKRIFPETSHFYRKIFYLRGYGVAIFCQMG